MKLAIVIKDYDESRGGAERYLVGLLPRLAPQCDTVDLIVNRARCDPPPGVNVRIVNALRWSSVLTPLSFNWAVQRLVKRECYDVVYGLTQIYPQDVYRAGGGLEHRWFTIKYPTLWRRCINRLMPRTAVRLYIENKIFTPGNYKKIITNSHLCKYQILHRYCVSPEDIAVVPNGVDTRIFNFDVKTLYREQVRHDLGIPGDARILLFIANNWKRKGLGELLRALALLGQNNHWLLVVGRGKPAVYQRQARSLGVDDRVRFTGTTDEPQRYYGASDVCVLPAYYEPCANVCLEALRCGIPVVTTRMNGAAEFIEEGKTGYVIADPAHIRELAESIRKALFLNRDTVDETAQSLTIERNVQQSTAILNDAHISKTKDGAEIFVNNGYRKLVRQKGWLDFDSVMQERDGILYKKNVLRSVVKINAKDTVFFLKRHFKNDRHCWALKEWQNIFRLKALGIQTMTPVAVGRKGRQAFLITESLESAQRLEDFIKTARFTIKEKRLLIRDLANLTRTLHRSNLFHKDFYTGHIFIEHHEHGFTLYLIDLQRLAEHLVFRTRWRVKDLASLNYTSGGMITGTDKMRFLKHYLNVEDVSKHKRFMRKILKKTHRIALHTPKKLRKKKT